MDVRVYTPELNRVGIIDNFRSLLWHRKYSEVGTFEFVCPATPYNVNILQMENIITYRGAAEAGVIESRTIEQDATKNEITVKGRFLSSYMDRRLVYGENTPSYNYSGRVEVGMRTILENAVAIPLVELGELQGFTETVTFQSTYRNLLKLESTLAKGFGFGFRFRPDFTNKKIYFEVYKGLDHSASQTDRTRVIFSDQYNNIKGAQYFENEQILKNVCYVGGEGEGQDRVWVVVGDDTLTGLERREMSYNASGINSDDLTQEQYLAKLQQAGENALNENSLVQTFECDTEPEGNFIYKTHYDLGDIVTEKKESWGLSLDLRLTEITEVYEHGKATIIPTFGSPLAEKINLEED